MSRLQRSSTPQSISPPRKSPVSEGLAHPQSASNPSHTDKVPESYRAALADEARRLRHFQLKAEALALRCVPGRRGLTTPRAEELRRRALARAARYQARFHRTIDALMSADGFDEAMRILREHRRHRQPPVYLLGPHFWG